MSAVETKAPGETAGENGDPENLIEVRGLLSQFGEQVIHKDLDLDVVRGEVLGVVGGSGTGKTVLLELHHRAEGARRRHHPYLRP